jgi:hypothetical protein
MTRIERYLRLRDVEAAAADLDEVGVSTRIEYRRIDEPNVTDWKPVAWENTLAGRLGYEPFPGYGIEVKAGESGD